MTALVATGPGGRGAAPGHDDSRPRQPGVANALSDLMEALARAWRTAADELSPGKYLMLTSLVVLAVLALSFCFDLVVVSRFEYRAAQTRAFDKLRNELAHGLAPVSQVDRKGRVLRLGSPVALLEIPALHLRTVVLEGTTPEVLTSGPGHLRDTVLPGQAGTSDVLGRAAAYGGPFGGIHGLRKGDTIKVTTGMGVSMFAVVDVRRAGDPVPSPPESGARLTLVTATGAPFLPSGVLRVDADLTGEAKAATAPVVTSVPRSELAMGTDTSTLWVLVFVMQFLILASVGSVWSWRRWGRAQTWIVFFPLFALLGYFAVDQFVRLLPNLM
jgi:sortase A